jgi:peptidase E
MVVITSNGLSSNQLLHDVHEYTQHLSTAVIVTTASNPLKGDRDLTRLKTELEQLHLDVAWFDFDRDDPEKLQQYDVVEMSGGDPFYLRESICKAKAEGILETIAHDKVLIGISAGAIVQQKEMGLLARFSAETGRRPVSRTDGIGIVAHEIMPHYKQFCERYFGFEERIQQYEIETGRVVTRLSDGEGIILTDV